MAGAVFYSDRGVVKLRINSAKMHNLKKQKHLEKTEDRYSHCVCVCVCVCVHVCMHVCYYHPNLSVCSVSVVNGLTCVTFNVAVHN